MKALGTSVPWALATVVVALSSAARADVPAPDALRTSDTARDVKNDVPIVAYTYQAYGVSAGTMGAQLTGLGLAASGQRAIAGGGVTLWGAPVERLTLVGDAQRNMFGNFAPSAAVIYRLFGSANDGFSLAALGKLKIDGFAAGPSKDEIESEIELGVLASYVRGGWHLDLNAVAGRGTGDDGETDAEARFRAGKDIGRWLRVGIDAQSRLRLAGPKYLPNGQTWDFAAGPQLMIGSRHFYAAFTGGPATMGLVSPNVGWTVVASIGGATL